MLAGAALDRGPEKRAKASIRSDAATSSVTSRITPKAVPQITSPRDSRMFLSARPNELADAPRQSRSSRCSGDRPDRREPARLLISAQRLQRCTGVSRRPYRFRSTPQWRRAFEYEKPQSQCLRAASRAALDRGVAEISLQGSNGRRYRRRHLASINATAVSNIRLEKPHSLSYQLETLTRRPETFVRVASKIDERASWLKSLDTSGSAL